MGSPGSETDSTTSSSSFASETQPLCFSRVTSTYDHSFSLKSVLTPSIIATRLLDPFIAHWKTSQDQVAKGGCSIVL
ncbi:hypothetical protein Bca101_066754 [Brassica carinata]